MIVADKKKRTTKPKKVEIVTANVCENVKLSITEIKKDITQPIAPKFNRELCLCNYISCEYQLLRDNIADLQNHDFLTMDVALKDELLKKMFSLYLMERKYRTE